MYIILCVILYDFIKVTLSLVIEYSWTSTYVGAQRLEFSLFQKQQSLVCIDGLQ